MVRNLLGAVLALVVGAGAAMAAEPVVRVGVLKFGTVNWLMQTVSTNGFDTANGVKLEVVPLAGKPATTIAFQARDVDVIVTDWIWAMSQRAKGAALRFSPYSTALGALVTREKMADLCAIKGRPVGVVGGAQDKSWLVLQALTEKTCGFDLAAETEALFGAPPLMSRQLETGTIDAVSTFWPFVARLEAKGMHQLMGITAALAELQIEPAPPLVGFVWDEAETDAALITGLIAAIAQAGALLATDDAAWEAVRPLMRVKTDEEFIALRDAYRAGIPDPWRTADTEAAAKLYQLLTERAGSAFSAQAGPFDAAVFPDPEGN